MHWLMRGSSGPSVLRLQKGLNWLFRPSSRLAEDGIFGHKTERTVRAFQLEFRLRVDGIVGPNTWQTLIMLAPGSRVETLPVLAAGRERPSIESDPEGLGADLQSEGIDLDAEKDFVRSMLSSFRDWRTIVGSGPFAAGYFPKVKVKRKLFPSGSTPGPRHRARVAVVLVTWASSLGLAKSRINGRFLDWKLVDRLGPNLSNRVIQQYPETDAFFEIIAQNDRRAKIVDKTAVLLHGSCTGSMPSRLKWECSDLISEAARERDNLIFDSPVWSDRSFINRCASRLLAWDTDHFWGLVEYLSYLRRVLSVGGASSISIKDVAAMRWIGVNARRGAYGLHSIQTEPMSAVFGS